MNQSLATRIQEEHTTYFDLNAAEAVETLLRRVIQLDPQGEFHASDMQALCMVLASTEREDEATQLVKNEIVTKPSTAAVTLAGMQMRAGDDDGAHNP